jgi:hypothetical protein
MSHFGYKFLAKTPELIVQRRITLDWYANLAQISQLIIHLIISYSEFVTSATVRNAQKRRDSSSERQHNCAESYCKKSEAQIGYKSSQGVWHVWTVDLWTGLDCMAGVLVHCRNCAWYLKLFPYIGEQILTGIDYLHLTKRFGLIAAS